MYEYEASYTGHVLGCHRLLPVMAKCYQKMTSHDRLLQARTGEQVNEITGFINDKTGAPPLATTGFESLERKEKSALVALVNENMTLPVTSHPGWYGQSRSERLSIIHNRL